MRFHLRDGIRDHAKLGAFFSGVHESNRRFFWIDNVNRAAIGDVNAKRHFSLIRDDTVAASEFYVRFNRSIDPRCARRAADWINLLGRPAPSTCVATISA